MVKSRRSKSNGRTRHQSRKSRGVRKNNTRRSQSRKQKGGGARKRKLNAFFSKMVEAKKANAPVFSYKGIDYTRKQNARGMVFYAKK